MELSIIILNYKQKGLVKYCLKRLLDAHLPMEHEIIVVDNASQDGLSELIKSHFLSVKLITAKENKGYAAGNNLGLATAKGDYLLILNPDVTIAEKAIVKMLEFLKTHPLAGICGPKILNPDNSLQYTCLRFPDWRLPFFRRTLLGQTNTGKKWNTDYLMTNWDHASTKKVDWLFGAVLMLKKEALLKVGLLDEKYFLYLEDLDWCRRFWENNWEVWYVPEAETIHFHQRQSAEANLFNALFSKTARTHLASWLKYYFKFKSKQLPKIS